MESIRVVDWCYWRAVGCVAADEGVSVGWLLRYVGGVSCLCHYSCDECGGVRMRNIVINLLATERGGRIACCCGLLLIPVAGDRYVVAVAVNLACCW